MAQSREEYLRKKREHMKKLRSNQEYRKKENIQKREHMKKLRSNQEYRKKENIQKREHSRKLRSNQEYRKKENIQKREHSRKLRSNPEYREKENKQKREHSRKLRSNPEYREKENKQKREYHRKLRSNPEYREKENKQKRDSSKKIKFKVLKQYSEILSKSSRPCCNCCGIKSHIEFLTIDHIDGKKNYSLVEQKLRGHNLYSWLSRNNFPKGYQVLCFNCNLSKGFLGECVHKKPHNLDSIHSKYNRKLKHQALFGYSKKPSSRNYPVCSCCNENEIDFLSIDHIDGRKYLKNEEKKLVGPRLYRFLIKNNFPSGYQVLCYNCNSAKSDRGFCPHKRK